MWPNHTPRRLVCIIVLTKRDQGQLKFSRCGATAVLEGCNLLTASVVATLQQSGILEED